MTLLPPSLFLRVGVCRSRWECETQRVLVSKEEGQIVGPREQPGVKIVRDNTGSELMEAGIDEIQPGLERLDAHAASREGGR